MRKSESKNELKEPDIFAIMRKHLEMKARAKRKPKKLMDPVCYNIRRKILRASRASGHGHLPTCFSVVEMISSVYGTMRHNPKNPQWNGRDIFILSKGHAALGYYCTLSEYGYIPENELKTFGAFGTRLGCHPDRHKVPGAEVSTGSLGHGISVAAGIALAFKIQNSKRMVYVLVGDGESNEGSVWEAIMVAVNLKLNNLTILYDNNRSQERSLPIKNPSERFKAFGCEVIDVSGHNVKEIKKALTKKQTGVKAVVCQTVKGFPCKTLIDNVFEWHRKAPDDSQFNQLMKELDEKAI